MGGYFYQLQLSLRHNFASKQALVYGFIVPIFFLIAFGTVFRSGQPPLIHQMSQLLTISALGGACFGLPTGLVAERERGWLRRYRLLPRAAAPLILATLTARFFLIASAGLIQLGLAHLLYGTPWPQSPGLFAFAYLFVAFAFLGLGLLVAALARDVPAVQALGQCVFLPLIMIGGVGVPLVVLPAWAQRLAGFLPGRYSVDALQAGFSGESGSLPLHFNLAALAAIGAAAGWAGARLFRWDPGHTLPPGARRWVFVALLPWAAAGTAAIASGHWQASRPTPTDPNLNARQSITEADYASIRFDGLPPDDGTVTPLAASLDNLDSDEKARIDQLDAQLETWAPGLVADPRQAMRNLLSVAAVADLREDPLEGAVARTVVNRLMTRFPAQILMRSLAWIILHPEEGTVLASVPELGFPDEMDPGTIRERVLLYAGKVLGRLRGQIPS